MPITVACPGCHSKLNAPDAAAGKKVKCPKCQGLLVVPADEFEVVEDDFETVEDDFEVVDEKPSGAATRSPRSGAREENRPRKPIHRDDDEEEERHRKKLKKRPKAKSNLLLYIGGGVLLLILATCGGLFLLGLGASKVVREAAEQAKLNNTWVEFTSPDGTFTASFPGSAPSAVDPTFMMTLNADADAMAETRKGMEKLKAVGIKLEAWSSSVGQRRYSIGLMTFPEAVRKNFKPEEAMKSFQNALDQSAVKNQGRERKVFEKNIIVSGQNAKQLGAARTSAKAVQVLTYLCANGRTFFVIVDGEEIDEGDAMLASFIQKFQLKSADGR